MDTRTGLLIIAYVAFGLFTFWVVARYFFDEAGDMEGVLIYAFLLWPLFWLVLLISALFLLIKPVGVRLELIVARCAAFCRKDVRQK